MAMRVLLCLADRQWAEWLAGVVGCHGEVELGAGESRGALLAAIDDLPAGSVVVIRVHAEALELGTDIIQAVAETHPALPIVAVGDTDAGGVMLPVVRAGAEDFLVRGSDDARLSDVLQRFAHAAERARAPAREQPAMSRGRGSACLFLSARTSADTVFFAAHVALALAGRFGPDDTGQRVLLIDASVPAGTLSILFGQKPDFFLRDALADVERCDDTLIDSAFPSLGRGVFYLANAEREAVVEADNLWSRLPALVDKARGLVDQVLVVMDSGVQESVVTELEAGATQCLLCLDTSVVQVRHTAALMSRLQSHGAARHDAGLIVTRQMDRQGLDAARLEELLSRPVVANLSDRLSTRQQAMDAGRVLERSSATESFIGAAEQIARSLSGQSGNGVAGRGAAGRLRRAWLALKGR